MKQNEDKTNIKGYTHLESDTEDSDAKNTQTILSTKQRKVQQQSSAIKETRQLEMEQRTIL
jgi:hypothetical protein